MSGYQEVVADLMAENGALRAEIARLREALEFTLWGADPKGSWNPNHPGDEADPEWVKRARAAYQGRLTP